MSIQRCMWCSDYIPSDHAPDDNLTDESHHQWLTMTYLSCVECAAIDGFKNLSSKESSEVEAICIQHKLDDDLWLSDLPIEGNVICTIQHQHRDGSIYKVCETASRSVSITF